MVGIARSITVHQFRILQFLSILKSSRFHHIIIIDWLIDLSIYLFMIDWFVGWLADWLIGSHVNTIVVLYCYLQFQAPLTEMSSYCTYFRTFNICIICWQYQ